MVKGKRPFLRPYIFLLALASTLLVACTGQLANESWPGLTADSGIVYVSYGPGVLAYDVSEQTQQWIYPAETSSAPFFAAPSVQDDRIVVGDFGASGGFLSPQSIVTIYGLEDGQSNTPTELWTNQEIASDRIVAQPLQVGSVAYVGTADNMLFALDAESGSVLWQFETGHSIWAQPTYHDGTLYLASLDRTLYALNAESGAEIWRTELTGALSGKPIVGDGLVYVSNFDSKLHALDLETGEERWSVEADDWIWAPPSLVGGVLYFADSQGGIYAADAVTGEQIWKQQGPGAVQTSPVVNGNMVYVASQGDLETGQGVLAAYAIEDGTEVWRQNTVAPLYTTPVVVEDTVVVALQSESALLIGYNPETGGQEWLLPPPAQ